MFDIRYSLDTVGLDLNSADDFVSSRQGLVASSTSLTTSTKMRSSSALHSTGARIARFQSASWATSGRLTRITPSALRFVSVPQTHGSRSFSTAADAYAGRIKTILGRVVALQESVDEKVPQWRQLVKESLVHSSSTSDATMKIAVLGEDFSGKSVVVRTLLDDDTVDQQTSDFLAKTLARIETPTRIQFGEKAEFVSAPAGSQFDVVRTPTQWLDYCSSEVVFLPGLYNFDVQPNRQILDSVLLEADAILLVSDITRQLTGSREIALMERLQALGRADRLVICVNQTDRLDNEAIGVAKMTKEVERRARTHAPGLTSPVYFTAAKRALVAPVGLRSAVEEGEPVKPADYQNRLASARVDKLREQLLSRVIDPTHRSATKNITNLAVGQYALERLERELEVVYKSIANYHHEVTLLTDAIRKEESRVIDDAAKKTSSEIARVLINSEDKVLKYVESRSLWRFLWRMEPISLEATRRLMGSSLVHINNAQGGSAGFTWEGVQTLREVEMLFAHAVGRSDGIMQTLGNNLRNLLRRIGQSRALARHSLSKEFETDILRIVEQLDRELDMSSGMSPVKIVSSPVSDYEDKVKKAGDLLQSKGDSTVLTTVGYEVGLGNFCSSTFLLRVLSFGFLPDWRGACLSFRYTSWFP